jgi:hypothetical protein
MAPPLPQVVANNVRAKLDVHDNDTGVAKLIKLGFANGTAQRILGGQTSIGLKILEKLAKRLHMQPWMLCVPELDDQDSQPRQRRWGHTRLSTQPHARHE